MRILVACEESGVVTKEFRDRGHEAYSCDVLPTSGELPFYHLQQDVLPLLEEEWDMIVAFPPCTHLCVSGARWFKEKREDGRQQAGIDFFMAFANAKAERVVIENPVGIMSTQWRKPTQIVRPYEYGDNSTKSTCLWLRGVEPLVPTDVIPTTRHTTKSGKSYDQWWWDTCMIGDLKKRAEARSKTFPGIAKAMAEQWG